MNAGARKKAKNWQKMGWRGKIPGWGMAYRSPIRCVDKMSLAGPATTFLSLPHRVTCPPVAREGWHFGVQLTPNP
jgi:hypothetical protein